MDLHVYQCKLLCALDYFNTSTKTLCLLGVVQKSCTGPEMISKNVEMYEWYGANQRILNFTVTTTYLSEKAKKCEKK